MNPSHPDWHAVRVLFDAVAELAPADRDARLSEPALDAAVVAEVRSLLAHAGETSAFLQQGAAPPAVADRSGQRLGAWRISGLLGSGGMGEVWLARARRRRLRRRAAIKLLKRGMDSRPCSNALRWSSRRWRG
jgi:hypothetical protein